MDGTSPDGGVRAYLGGGVRMRTGMKGLLAVAFAAMLAAVPACSKNANTTSGSNDSQVEVFSWWTGPGEQEGLAAMVDDFKKNNTGVNFINAAVSGGAGSNAKAILANRLLANDPPDSYQRHAGLELADDIKAGKVQDLTSLYQEQGWTGVFPQGLIDKLTIDGKIYAVPVNIHRANLLWFNPKTLQKADIATPPKTWSEFLTQAATLKAKGITALSIGPEWTQKHLLETVLLGQLGADRYEGLWTGKTDWKGADVADALNVYKQILSFSDIKSAAADWQPALEHIIDGTAAYNVMGDWSYSYLAVSKKLGWKTDYDVVASPGTDGIYDFLSDSFTLPVGAKHPQSAKKWLIECGSKAGQDLFNPQKGSVPARKDADTSLYKDYLAWDLQQWQNTGSRIVGSLTHGVVANNAWNTDIDTALGLYVNNGDTAKFASAVASAYAKDK
jgi:glucose/mannose transport system substrate-binding protein